MRCPSWDGTEEKDPNVITRIRSWFAVQDAVQTLGGIYIASLLFVEWLIVDSLVVPWHDPSLLDWTVACGAFAPALAVGPVLPAAAILGLAGRWGHEETSH